MKRTVREELEYWNVILIIHKLKKYFNSLHGYESDRGISGLTADDFAMIVLEKIVSGERSWEKSKRTDFIGFCLDAMKSEIYNARHSAEYKNTARFTQAEIEDQIESEKHRIRWERNGLKDDFNGF